MNRLLDENFVPTAGLTPLVEVMSEVYQCFGGPRQFASQMYEQMMEVLKKKPASPSSVGLFLRFMQLQLKVEEKIQEQETSDMTDEQLRREQEIGLMKMFLDAAGDPQRRKMLDRLLGLQGIKLTNMTPEQVLHDGSGIQTSEQVEPGVGAS